MREMLKVIRWQAVGIIAAIVLFWWGVMAICGVL